MPDRIAKKREDDAEPLESLDKVREALSSRGQDEPDDDPEELPLLQQVRSHIEASSGDGAAGAPPDQQMPDYDWEPSEMIEDLQGYIQSQQERDPRTMTGEPAQAAGSASRQVQAFMEAMSGKRRTPATNLVGSLLDAGKAIAPIVDPNHGAYSAFVHGLTRNATALPANAILTLGTFISSEKMAEFGTRLRADVQADREAGPDFTPEAVARANEEDRSLTWRETGKAYLDQLLENPREFQQNVAMMTGESFITTLASIASAYGGGAVAGAAGLGRIGTAAASVGTGTVATSPDFSGEIIDRFQQEYGRLPEGVDELAPIAGTALAQSFVNTAADLIMGRILRLPNVLGRDLNRPSLQGRIQTRITDNLADGQPLTTAIERAVRREAARVGINLPADVVKTMTAEGIAGGLDTMLGNIYWQEDLFKHVPQGSIEGALVGSNLGAAGGIRTAVTDASQLRAMSRFNQRLSDYMEQHATSEQRALPEPDFGDSPGEGSQGPDGPAPDAPAPDGTLPDGPVTPEMVDGLSWDELEAMGEQALNENRLDDAAVIMDAMETLVDEGQGPGEQQQPDDPQPDDPQPDAPEPDAPEPEGPPDTPAPDEAETDTRSTEEIIEESEELTGPTDIEDLIPEPPLTDEQVAPDEVVDALQDLVSDDATRTEETADELQQNLPELSTTQLVDLLESAQGESQYDVIEEIDRRFHAGLRENGSDPLADALEAHDTVGVSEADLMKHMRLAFRNEDGAAQYLQDVVGDLSNRQLFQIWYQVEGAALDVVSDELLRRLREALPQSTEQDAQPDQPGVQDTDGLQDGRRSGDSQTDTDEGGDPGSGRDREGGQEPGAPDESGDTGATVRAEGARTTSDLSAIDFETVFPDLTESAQREVPERIAVAAITEAKRFHEELTAELAKRYRNARTLYERAAELEGEESNDARFTATATVNRARQLLNEYERLFGAAVRQRFESYLADRGIAPPDAVLPQELQEIVDELAEINPRAAQNITDAYMARGEYDVAFARQLLERERQKDDSATRLEEPDYDADPELLPAFELIEWLEQQEAPNESGMIDSLPEGMLQAFNDVMNAGRQALVELFGVTASDLNNVSSHPALAFEVLIPSWSRLLRAVRMWHKVNAGWKNANPEKAERAVRHLREGMENLRDELNDRGADALALQVEGALERYTRSTAAMEQQLPDPPTQQDRMQEMTDAEEQSEFDVAQREAEEHQAELESNREAALGAFAERVGDMLDGLDTGLSDRNAAVAIENIPDRYARMAQATIELIDALPDFLFTDATKARLRSKVEGTVANIGWQIHRKERGYEQFDQAELDNAKRTLSGWATHLHRLIAESQDISLLQDIIEEATEDDHTPHQATRAPRSSLDVEPGQVYADRRGEAIVLVTEVPEERTNLVSVIKTDFDDKYGAVYSTSSLVGDLRPITLPEEGQSQEGQDQSQERELDIGADPPQTEEARREQERERIRQDNGEGRERQEEARDKQRQEREQKEQEAKEPTVAEILEEAGLEVTEGVTRRGNAVWEVSGNTKVHRHVLKSLGGKWYNPKKVWSFYDGDPSAEIARKLADLPTREEDAGGPDDGRTGVGVDSEDAGDGAQSGVAAEERDRLEQLRERLNQSGRERADDQDVSEAVTRETVDLLERGLELGVPEQAIKDQVEDVGLIKDAFDRGRGAFVLAGGTGTGKTFVIAAAIREMRESGYQGRVLWVTVNQNQIEQAKRDTADYELGNVEYTTYASLSRGNVPDPGGVVVFDESHRIKNTDSNAGEAGAEIIHSSRFALFASATPFSNPVELEYLSPTGIFSEWGGFTNFAIAHGASVRKYINAQGKEVRTVYWTDGNKQGGRQAREYLLGTGLMSQRLIKLDEFGVEARFHNVGSGEHQGAGKSYETIYEQVDAAYWRAIDMANKDGQQNAVNVLRLHRVNALKRVLESSKVDAAIERTEHHLNDDPNKQVVIFTETKSSRSLDFQGDPYVALEELRRWEKMDKEAAPEPPYKYYDVFLAIALDEQDLLGITLPSVVEEIQKHFGEENVGIFTGAVTSTQARKNREAWEAGEQRILVATMAKGGTGLSLHDTVGDKPRAQININLPWTAAEIDQVSGRTARYGMKSPAVLEWLFNPELAQEAMLRERVGRRLQDLGAVVQGRDLKSAETLVDREATEADTVDVSQHDLDLEQQGDKAASERNRDVYDLAEQLERARRPTSEFSQHADFFATPYPLAAAMARILQAARGETVLEPSVGHGQIARMIHEVADLSVAFTLVDIRADHEPNLQPALAQMQGRETNVRLGVDFLDFEHPFQFDAIAMNPPFSREAGQGWRDIIHVMQAYDEHLAPGGRLVAVMSEGVFFRQDAHSTQFREFLDSVGAYVIDVPRGAFAKSGTGVKTRIVIIDKVPRGEPAPPTGTTDVNLSSMEEIREIEEYIPDRPYRTESQRLVEQIEIEGRKLQQEEQKASESAEGGQLRNRVDAFMEGRAAVTRATERIEQLLNDIQELREREQKEQARHLHEERVAALMLDDSVIYRGELWNVVETTSRGAVIVRGDETKSVQANQLELTEETAQKVAERLGEADPSPTDQEGTDQAEPTVPEEGARRSDVYEIPLSELHTDPSRFQPRGAAFAEESASRIHRSFDRQELDPLRVWKDPKNGRWYVLAGHSRYEGQRRRQADRLPDSETLPVHVFEGTEAEAIDFAMRENDKGTAMQPHEQAAYIRRQLDEGKTLAEIKETARELYGKNARTIIALAHLNPKGRVMNALQALDSRTDDGRELLTMAKWIGEARRRFSGLTHGHEAELFDYLMGRFRKEDHTRSEAAFKRWLHQDVVQLFEDDLPTHLNLEGRDTRITQERKIDSEVTKARRELQESKRERDRMHSKYVKAGISQEQLDKLMKPYHEAVAYDERRLTQLMAQREQAKKDARDTQAGLFDRDAPPELRSRIDNLRNEHQLTDEQIYQIAAMGHESLAAIERLSEIIEAQLESRSLTQKERNRLKAVLEDIKMRGEAKLLSVSNVFQEPGSSKAILGETFEDLLDLAEHLQVFRDTSVESMRWIFVKDGRIVGVQAVSSRDPGSTTFKLPGEDVEGAMYRIEQEMEALGADKVYMVHNHPHGLPEPSEADKRVTKMVAIRLGSSFGGHVIINSGTFATIEYDGFGLGQLVIEHHKLDVPDDWEDPLQRPLEQIRAEHPVMAWDVEDLTSLGILSSRVFGKTGGASFFLVSRDHLPQTGEAGVTGIIEVPIQWLYSDKLPDLVEAFARRTGQAPRQIYLMGLPIQDMEKGLQLWDEGVVANVATVGGHVVSEERRLSGGFANPFAHEMRVRDRGQMQPRTVEYVVELPDGREVDLRWRPDESAYATSVREHQESFGTQRGDVSGEVLFSEEIDPLGPREEGRQDERRRIVDRMRERHEQARAEAREQSEAREEEGGYMDQPDGQPTQDRPFLAAGDPYRGEGRIDVDPIEGGERDLRDVVEGFLDTINRRYRKGGTRGMRVLGLYWPGSQRISLKHHNDLDTLAHELGHLLDDEHRLIKEPKEGEDSPFDDELIPQFSEATSLESYTRSQVRREGVAEFVRAYIVNPEAAKKKAPNFAAHFEQTVPDDVLEALRGFSEAVREWAGQSATGRTLSNVELQTESRGILQRIIDVFKRDPDLGDRPVLTELQRGVTDDKRPLVVAVEAAKKMQGIWELLPENDPVLLTRLLSGNDRLVDRIMQDGMIDTKGEHVTEGGFDWLVETLNRETTETLEQDMGWVISVLINERVLEKEEQWMGLARHIQQATADITEMQRYASQARNSIALLRNHIRRLKAGQEVTYIDRQGQEHGLTEEAAREQIKEYEGEIEIYQEVIGELKEAIKEWRSELGYTGSANTVVERTRRRINRMVGTGGGIFADPETARQALEEFKELPEERREAIQTAVERYRTWADHVLQYYRDRGRISAEQYKEIRDNNQMYVSLQRLMNDLPSDLRAATHALSSKAKIIHQLKGSTRRIKNPYVSLIAQTQAMIREADRNNILRQLRDLLDSDRDFHEGLPRDLDAIGSRADEGDPGAIEIIVDGQSEYWQFNERLADSINAVGEVHSDHVVFRALQVLPRIQHDSITLAPAFIIRNSLRDAFQRGVLSEHGAKPWGALKFLHPEGMEDFQDLYSEFDRYGGGLFGFYGTNQQSYNKRLRDSMNRVVERSDSILTDPGRIFRAYERFASMSETQGRIDEYKQAKKHALEELEYDEYNASLYAAAAARGITDYARAGTVVREINKYLIFTNAAVQALARSYRGIRSDPTGFLMRWTAYVLSIEATVILWNLRMGAQEEWEQFPAYLKDSFWSYKIGPDLWLRVPKPWEMGVTASIGTRAYAGLQGDENAFEGFARSVLNAMAPVDESAVAGPARVIAEPIANYDFFRERRMVPWWEEGLDLELRTGTEYASNIGQLLQEAFRVDARKIDHIINQFGGIGRSITAASNVVGRGLPERRRLLQEVTGLSIRGPAVGARDVAWVNEWAKRRGMQQSQEVRQLRAMVEHTYAAEEPAEVERRAAELREFASELRRNIEAQERADEEGEQLGPRRRVIDALP